MTQPEMVVCAECKENVYPHNLATFVQWVVVDGELTGKRDVRLPYCVTCQRKTGSGHGNTQGLKERLMGMYEATLMADYKPGDGERKCNRCTKWKPVSLFQWNWQGAGSKAHRRGTCYPCITLNKGRADTAVAGKASAFDVARERIEARSGKRIEAWTQQLHETHCLLMRELCNIPHHIRLDEHRIEQEAPDSPSHLKEIRLWTGRSQRVQHWLNGSPLSINGVTASSNVST